MLSKAQKKPRSNNCSGEGGEDGWGGGGGGGDLKAAALGEAGPYGTEHGQQRSEESQAPQLQLLLTAHH